MPEGKKHTRWLMCLQTEQLSAKTTTIKAMPSTVSQPNRQVAVFHGRTKVLPLTIFAARFA
jgi:hypothetical protein